MSLVSDNFKYEENFWNRNQELLIIKEFRDLYEEKGIIFSSKVMWAVYFVYDYQSRFAHLPIPQRRRLAEIDYIQEEGFMDKNSELLQPVIDRWIELQKDSERRYLETWVQALEVRRGLISSISENLKIDMADQLDKLLLNSGKLLEEKDKLMKRINKEEGSKVKGSQRLSLLEKEELQSTVDFEKIERLKHEASLYNSTKNEKTKGEVS